MAALNYDANKPSEIREVQKLPHHERMTECTTRPGYREGKRTTAVKVYTANSESCYLLIHGVPAVGVTNELHHFCSEFGEVEKFFALDEYATQEFNEVYLVKYKNIRFARVGKKKMDDRPFYGGCLHVCYAPEFETVQETREKLQERRKYVAGRIKSTNNQNTQKKNAKSSAAGAISVGEPSQMYHNNSASPVASNIPVSSAKQEVSMVPPTSTYIWAGKAYTCTTNEITQVPTEVKNEQYSGANQQIPQSAEYNWTCENVYNNPNKGLLPPDASLQPENLVQPTSQWMAACNNGAAAASMQQAVYDNANQSERRKLPSPPVPNVEPDFKRQKK